MKKILTLSYLIFLLSVSGRGNAQSPYEGLCCPTPPNQGATPTSYDIYEDIQRLQFLGSVLYLAAHPDDENTGLITYLSNHLKANTSYLSLTRGDGGQNRIGTELREQLGVIRTQELLAARSVDGGQQFFSRANDFGFSKNAEETLEIWNAEALLEDIVWVIRQVQPDVIINRFDHRTSGSTHGHHTASAILSKKAFSMAGNKTVFPQQQKYVAPFSPERIFFNTSRSFYGSQEEFEAAGQSGFTQLDIGVYYPGKGKSNNEISATSRSQHRCQGMGTTPVLGKKVEYLELLAGKRLLDQNDIFSGINTTWSRLKGGDSIAKMVAHIEKDFQFSAPYKSIPKLVELWNAIQQLEDSHWKKVKSEELKKIILDCTLLHVEVLAESQTYVAGETISLSIEFVNQSPYPLELSKIEGPGFEKIYQQEIPYNESLKISIPVSISKATMSDNPYWLNTPASLGMYTVTDPLLRGKAETPAQLEVNISLFIEGTAFDYSYPIAYKFTDPVVGQIYEAVKVVPPVFVKTAEEVYIFPNEGPRTIVIEVTAGKKDISGKLFPGQSKNWKSEPAFYDFQLKQKGMSKRFEFQITPPKMQEEAELQPYIEMDSIRHNRTLHDIRYQHIPRQLVLLSAHSKTVRLDIKTLGNKIAYLMGAGDVIPEQLRQIGYRVDLISTDDLRTKQLQNYDALILGIRALNVLEDLSFKQKVILDYTDKGGTVIIQYNTNHRLLVEQPGPYPMVLSKDRVTKENALITILKPDHTLLNYPNKITTKDFDNWVQERGLYFPSQWDERYQTLLSCHDPGESDKVSGLLYTPYGKGHFIYTGYSFFRQLPAGVPGAFRLFANLISVGKVSTP